MPEDAATVAASQIICKVIKYEIVSVHDHEMHFKSLKIKLHTIKRQLIFTGTKRKKAYDIHIIK